MVRIRTFRIGHTVNSLFKRVVFEMTYPLVQAQLLPAPVVEGWLRSCQGYHQHWREPTVQLRGRQGYAVLAALFLGWSQSGSEGTLPVSAVYYLRTGTFIFYVELWSWSRRFFGISRKRKRLRLQGQLQLSRTRAVDPGLDPHSFSLLYSKCGSGSRRENFSEKIQGNW